MIKSLFLSINPDRDFLAPFTLTKLQVLSECLTRWHPALPTPPYYTLPQQLRPHLWLKLDKFTGGHFHQMRALNSYLEAHQSWYNQSLSARCPRCYNVEKDLQCAILECLVHLFAREKFIHDLQSIDDIWNSPHTSIKSHWVCARHSQATPEVCLVGSRLLPTPPLTLFLMGNLSSHQSFLYLCEMFRFPVRFIIYYFS
jgi:hypothetical protein